MPLLQPYNFVHIKFDSAFTMPILFGVKTKTTRLSQKGNVGDIFTVGGANFEIIDVQCTTCYNSLIYFDSEGFDSVQDMFNSLRRYYPHLSLDTTVYVHSFVRLS